MLRLDAQGACEHQHVIRVLGVLACDRAPLALGLLMRLYHNTALHRGAGPSAAAAPESNAIEADHAVLEHLRPSEAKSVTASTPADADPGGPADISRPQTSGTKQEEAPRDPDAPPLPRPGHQAASNASPASAMTPEEGGQTGQAVPGQAAVDAVGIAAQATALEQGAEGVPVEGLPVVSDQNGQWYAWQDGSYQLVA